MIEIAKGNVQENITQHIKTFFLHNFDLNRNNKCTRKYNTTQKKRFLFSIILIEMKKQMYKKILHNTKNFFSIILIEITKGNVQENITQHKKNIFLHYFD